MDAQSMSRLEQRLQALEDQVAIYQIVCGYGYAVDGLNTQAVGELYAPDGVYAVADIPPYVGREKVAAITTTPGHVAMVGEGCAHMSSLPHVVIDGDRASATCYTALLRNGAGGFEIARLSASRLELSRKPGGGWQIDHRQNNLLNGDPAGPAMLARLKEPPKRARA
jgi:hypothetical protein